jgi:hypothetical protein
MKTKSLILILLCSFLLAPSYSWARDNDWYQGHQGQWQRQGNDWQWRSTHGNDCIRDDREVCWCLRICSGRTVKRPVTPVLLKS